MHSSFRRCLEVETSIEDQGLHVAQFQHNKLHVATSLKKQGLERDVTCCLCGEVESTNHVFFGCSISRFAWCCLRDAFGWAGCPSNWSDLMGDKVTKGMRLYNRLKIFVFAGIL